MDNSKKKKTYTEKIEIATQRDYQVVKSNEIIQKARYDLTLKEMKLFAFILSKVKPTDTKGMWYTFSFRDFFKVCGIDERSGKNYETIKQGLKKLADKSFYMQDENGIDILCRWIDKPKLDRRSGRVTVRLDEDMAQYFIGLTENFTQYALLYTLPMRSTYSMRLYEQLKSRAFTKKFDVDINELRGILACPYGAFKDLRRRALDVAIREINQYTDIKVQWEPVKAGNTVKAIRFKIKTKTPLEQSLTMNRNSGELDGQMTIYDLL